MDGAVVQMEEGSQQMVDQDQLVLWPGHHYPSARMGVRPGTPMPQCTDLGDEANLSARVSTSIMGRVRSLGMSLAEVMLGSVSPYVT